MEDLTELLGPLRELGAVGRRLDMTAFEDQSLEVAERALVPAVVRLLQVTMDALGMLERGCAELQERAVPDDEAEWFGVPAPDVGATKDVAALGALELAGRLEEIRRPGADLWTLLERCNAGRGAVVRTVAAVITAHDRGDPGGNGTTRDLESALRVREAYRAFQLRIAELGDPSPDEATDAIAKVAEAVEQLFASPVQREFRLSDRLQLRKLRAQLATALDGAEGDELHAWQEVRSVAELLLRVNDRQELVEHDRAALLGLVDALYSDPIDAERLYAFDLATLAGRDPQIDALVRAAEPRTTGRFVTAITRAALRLDAPATVGIIVN